MKKSIVPVIIILLVVLGLVAYFATSNKQKPSQPVVGNSQPSSAPVAAKNSLMDLLTQGKNVNCTYTSATDNVESTGTVYISGKKIRVDYSTTVDGKKTTGSMIRDENFSYVWGSGMPQGIKMKNASVELPTGSPQNNQGFDQTAKMDYKCQPWSPDNSMFNPPANVIFREITIPSPFPTGSSNAVNPVTGTASGNQAACAACANLPDQAKTTCLTQLHCQ